MQKAKTCRFINSNYKDLFTVPEGGYITITLDTGEQLIRQCKFEDECHTSVGNNIYHICEFAERMEQNQNTYEPCPEPEVVAGYTITDRMPVGDKVFVLAHNPNAATPWVTWQGYKNKENGYDWGHYWNDRSTARTDYFRRADADNRGVLYDYKTLIKEKNDRDSR